jgi:hypothetical protein
MRPPGLEPGPPTWKVRIIPLDYGRFHTYNKILLLYRSKFILVFMLFLRTIILSLF